MPEFTYQDPFPLGKDNTKYRLLTKDYVSVAGFEGKEILKVDPEGLTFLANKAMRDVSFLLRPSHLEKVAAILDDALPGHITLFDLAVDPPVLWEEQSVMAQGQFLEASETEAERLHRLAPCRSA